MEYTKGEWEVGEPFGKGQEYPIYASDHYELARVFIHNGEQETNARLIAAAVNACALVNPDNPMAVAESIKKMYEALKESTYLLELLHALIKDPAFKKLALKERLDNNHKALAKAEGNRKMSYTKERCNCHIEFVDKDTHQVGIVYCSKHAAAPDTADALKELISFLIHAGLTTNNQLVPIINRGTKALKKAEGK